MPLFETVGVIRPFRKSTEILRPKTFVQIAIRIYQNVYLFTITVTHTQTAFFAIPNSEDLVRFAL